jgi:hypothetical protein
VVRKRGNPLKIIINKRGRYRRGVKNTNAIAQISGNINDFSIKIHYHPIGFQKS